MLRVLFIVLFASACSAAAGAQDTWFVRATGNDASDGTTPATAVRTLGRAERLVRAGDTVVIGAGTYSERLRVNTAGTAAEPIVWWADTDGSLTGDAGSVVLAQGRDALDVRAGYHRFVGITVLGTHGSGTLISIMGGEDIRLENMRIESACNFTIWVRNNAGVTLTDVEILTDDDDSRGIRVDSGALSLERVQIIERVASKNDAITVRNSNATVRAQRLLIRGFSRAIHLENGTAEIANSVIDGADRGITLQNSSARALVVHSTVLARQFALDANSGSVRAHGSVVVSDGTGLRSRNGASVRVSESVVWAGSSAATGSVTLEAVIERDPELLRVAEGDYTPEAGSPAIDLVTPSGDALGLDISTDFLGNLRDAGSSRPDAGAVEVGRRTLLYAGVPYVSDTGLPPAGEWTQASPASHAALGGWITGAGARSPRLHLSTVPGERYTLEFDLALVGAWLGTQTGHGLRVTNNDAVAFDHRFASTRTPTRKTTYPVPPAIESVGGRLYRGIAVTFVASSSETVLAFQADAPSGGSYLLDNVRVGPAVPDGHRFGLEASWHRTDRRISRVHQAPWNEVDRRSIEHTIDWYAGNRDSMAYGYGDYFAVGLTGKLLAPTSGRYTFSLRSDDGSILWINGRQAVNHDGLHAPSTRSRSVELEAGWHEIRVEMFERTGQAALRLSWRRPGAGSTELVPWWAYAHAAGASLPFANATEELLRDVPTPGGVLPEQPRGIAVGDIDGDGDLDVYTGGAGMHTVYLNELGGDAGALVASRVASTPGQIALIDLDNDGDLEGITAAGGLWALREGGPETLGRTTDALTFWDSRALAVLDQNRDGFADAVYASTARTQIAMNEPSGGGPFSRGLEPRSSALSGLTAPGRTLMSADFGGDAMPDVIGMGDALAAALHTGNGFWTTLDLGDTIGGGSVGGAWETLPGASNQLGSAVIATGTASSPVQILVASEDVTDEGPARTGQLLGELTSSATWGDFDADGVQEILLATSHGVVVLVWNAEAERYEPHRLPTLLDVRAHDARFADIDGDGDLDIFVTSDEGDHLLLNTLNPQNTVKIRVRGRGAGATNAAGAGARVRVFDTNTSEVIGVRSVGAAEGHGQASLELVFGVPDPAGDYTAEVMWTTGETSTQRFTAASTRNPETGAVNPIVLSEGGAAGLFSWREVDQEEAAREVMIAELERLGLTAAADLVRELPLDEALRFVAQSSLIDDLGGTLEQVTGGVGDVLNGLLP